LPSIKDKAIEKQPAWAAAISSSGLVPGPFSKRDLKPYGASFKTPVSVEIVPPPSLMPPFQTADAFLMVMFAPWIAVPQCRARGKPALRAGLWPHTIRRNSTKKLITNRRL